jgi:hypothetical protein
MAIGSGLLGSGGSGGGWSRIDSYDARMWESLPGLRDPSTESNDLVPAG